MDFIFIMEQMPRLLPGLLLTIQLSLIGFLIATILGVPFGILRAYQIPAYVSFVIDFYVFVVRGTPILVQIYAAYFLLPLAGVKLSPFWIGIVALSFNSAGYQIEITRAAIQSIEKGQYEGALSLGLGKFRNACFNCLSASLFEDASSVGKRNVKPYKSILCFVYNYGF